DASDRVCDGAFENHARPSMETSAGASSGAPSETRYESPSARGSPAPAKKSMHGLFFFVTSGSMTSERAPSFSARDAAAQSIASSTRRPITRHERSQSSSFASSPERESAKIPVRPASPKRSAT